MRGGEFWVFLLCHLDPSYTCVVFPARCLFTPRGTPKHHPFQTSWARDQTCTELSIFCPVLSLCALVINPPSLPSFTLCCFSQALVNFLQFPIVTGSLLHPSGLPTPPHQVPNSYDIRPWSDSACIWYLDPPLTSSVTLGKLLNFPVPQFPYL